MLGPMFANIGNLAPADCNPIRHFVPGWHQPVTISASAVPAGGREGKEPEGNGGIGERGGANGMLKDREKQEEVILGTCE